MRTADMHCDTISKLYAERQEKKDSGNLRKNGFQVDLEKLKKGGCLVQNFAMYVDRQAVESPYETAMEMITLLEEELSENEDLILPARSYEEILENDRNGKMSAVLTLEEGAVFEGKLERIREFYDRGVRMAAVSWNYENEIGFPNLVWGEDGVPALRKRQERGLTAFGTEAVKEMERLHMLVDVSHLSDGGFWDVYRHTRAPFVASHSNAAAVSGVSRNLTDDMIRALGERGGVTGLNFCAAFLSEQCAFEENGMPRKDSSVCVGRLSDMVRHVRHITSVGGIEVCGLGTDFDGIGNSVELLDASGMELLSEALHRGGFTWEEIEKIFYKNVLRVYREVLK